MQQQTYAPDGDWFDAHPTEAKVIILKAQAAQQARLAARKAREATRRKSVLDAVSLPSKLHDCSSRDPRFRTVHRRGRPAGRLSCDGAEPQPPGNPSLRGKILNVEKARLERAMSSDTIQALNWRPGYGYR